MENASKAILMAGAVLIAVGVISFALYIFSVFRNYASTLEEVYTASQVESFNRFYESYPQGIIKGIDLQNLYNKAKEDEITVSVIVTDRWSAGELDAERYLDDFSYTIKARDALGRVASIELTE